MPPKKRRAATRRKVPEKNGKPWPEKGIEDLPTELLTAIFKFVHVFSMVVVEDTPERKASPGSVYRAPKKYSQTHFYHGLMEPELTQSAVVAFSFPLLTVSSVCRLWRDIAHNLPEYSSHLLIFIDENFTPLSEVRKQIERSGDIPLDVFVVNRDLDVEDEDEDDSQQDAEQEKSRVGSVMKLLAPLIPRCRSLVFDVKHSSSLPYISQDFRGHAPDLRVLKLQCMIDDGSSLPPPVPEIPAEEEFTCPLLNTITLDGSTFMDACNVPSWTNQLHSLIIDTLSISNFTAPDADEGEYSFKDEDFEEGGDEGEPFDLFDLTENLSNIGFIRNLIFNNISTRWREAHEDVTEIQLNNFTVIGNQDIDWMIELIRFSFETALCYYHLADTAPTWHSMPPVQHLRLQRTPDMKDYFIAAMNNFFGNRLDLIDCEGLSDELLLSVAGRCRLLRRLYIKQCPNITVEGLKRMITERNRLVTEEVKKSDEDEDDDSDSESILELDSADEELIRTGHSIFGEPSHEFFFRPIHRLVVVGHPKRLAKSNRQWFKDHVKSFHWE